MSIHVLLTDSLHVLALSYHRWLDMPVVLFFKLFILYPVTVGKKQSAEEEVASYEGIYAEAASASALAGIRRAMALGLLMQEETRQAAIVGILTVTG
jgi:hypothetical protein